MKSSLTSNSIISSLPFDDRQLARISATKIFFGHQSVGNNVIAGLQDLQLADPRLHINITSSGNPESVSHPALIEFAIGQNGNPQSKLDSFGHVLARGMGAQGGVAMFKFCYADIGGQTNVSHLFHNYRNEISTLKFRYPSLQIVHITVPLTTVESAAKAWVKKAMRNDSRRNANIARNRFNTLLKRTFAESDPIFDLAEAESTRPDGSRSYFIQNGDPIYSLVPEYASDAGHLNKAGCRSAALALLRVLSTLGGNSSLIRPGNSVDSNNSSST